jgi:catechol 2,3-dioxygenase-like lactoylglutathione lyase family enzyme
LTPRIAWRDWKGPVKIAVAYKPVKTATPRAHDYASDLPCNLGERSDGGMLAHSNVATRLPAQDLHRARSFYADKLGLTPAEERPGGLKYVCGNCSFVVFASSGRSSGNHTQMGFEVEDIEVTVAALRARGVVFEEYDLPGFKTINGIAEIAGNYPSRGGIGEKGAWFRDSEGNLLGIGQAIGQVFPRTR